MDHAAPTPEPVSSTAARCAAERRTLDPANVRIVREVLGELALVFAQNKVCESHGIRQAHDVARIAGHALRSHAEQLSPEDELSCLLAAALHDADDRKFFPGHRDYENARALLARVAAGRSAGFVAQTVRQISWVSAAANGESVPAEAAERPWMLFARLADRVAASGWTGVQRCWQYTLGVDRPLYTPATARALSEEDLWGRLATPERYKAYTGNSASMIDHYYDKLLRVGQFTTDNPYLAAEALRRSRPLVEVALAFGRDGALDAELYRHAAEQAEKETGEFA